MIEIAEFTIIHSDKTWIVIQNGCELARFVSRNDAETMVHMAVEERCREHKASRITIEKGLEREVRCCRCYDPPSRGTLLN